MSSGNKGYILAQQHVAYRSVRGSASCFLIRDLLCGAATILNVASHHHRAEFWMTHSCAKQLNALAQKQHMSALLFIHRPGLTTWLHPVPRSQEMAILTSPERKSRCQRAAPTSSTLGIGTHETMEKRDERNHNRISGEEKAWLLGLFLNPYWAGYKLFFSLSPLTSEELFINSLCTWKTTKPLELRWILWCVCLRVCVCVWYVVCGVRYSIV